MEIEVPKEFICSITHDCMSNPYTDKQGVSYERDAILEWLKNNNISPATRQLLTINDLTPNLALKSIIEKWKKDNNYVESNDCVKTNKNDLIEKIISNHTFNPENNTVSISVKGPEFIDQTRLPITWVFIVDISGSMGSIAIVKGQEDMGYSTLDLVKHSLKTQIHNMISEDKITLITYNFSAEIKCVNKKMDSQGKDDIMSLIDQMTPGGGTNIWDGIHKGMETINEDSVNPYLLLFTDGQPTVSPPRGEIYYLDKYIDEKGLKAPIYTYGFGKNLNEELLHNIAISGNISFVGTIFVHSQANIMSNIISNVVIRITDNNINNSNFLGNYKKQITSWGCEVYVGSLQYDQEKTIIVNKNISDIDNISVSYLDIRNNKKYEIESDEINNEQQIKNNIINYNRLLLIDSINKCIQIKDNNGLQENIDENINNVLQILKNSKVQNDYIQDLIKDVNIEIKKAFLNEYYNSWGKKYLLSILTSHLNQECNNFKDYGIQHYCLPLFKKIRDIADDIFIQLPAPTPSRKIYNYQSSNSTPRTLTNMSTFHQSSGPCFAPWCKVEMSNNTFKRVDEIKKGDIIKSINRNDLYDSSEVMCVIETEIEKSRCYMSNINNLIITPWHPVRIQGIWDFPENINKSDEIDCEKIYSFVLNKNHIMYINNIQCVTLGHGFQDNVVSHNYFGTDKVIKDLENMPGWNKGKIYLKPNPLVRDPNTGLVIKIIN
jgi:hypothetical protein